MDLSKYKNNFTLANKILRVIWTISYITLFYSFKFSFFNKWRILLLRIFGTKVPFSAIVYSNVKIWAPWNLEMGEYSCLGPNVDCYNQGKISIGANTIISQKTYLCASTHDYTNVTFPLICKPIQIGSQVWISADSFIGPGVSIGNGAVIGARSAVFKNVESWTVVGGNPAVFIKERTLL